MTVDEYLEAAPEPHRTTLVRLRKMLASILPDATQGMSYGVPAFIVDGQTVAGYAYFKNHCGYYPHSGSVLNQVEEELLDGYDWERGTLRFPIDRLPEEALIRRLVELRLAMFENGE